MAPKAVGTSKQVELAVEHIRQHKGPPQVVRSVKVLVPGKHFPGLQPAEQKVFYEGTAVGYTERHKFAVHHKAWGLAHTGPGIRFVCESDALEDPDHRGFWTTLALWNRWRHETYKDNREAELQYLDELPATSGKAAASVVKAEKEEPAIKEYFEVTASGEHIFGGKGRLAGTKDKCAWFACLAPGCSRGRAHPIKQVGTTRFGTF